MTKSESPRGAAASFPGYELEPRFFDEMFEADGTPRAACRRMTESLAGLAAEDLAKLQDSVYRRFLHEGITFTVLGGEDVTERIIPLDFVPRLMAGRNGTASSGV